MISDPTAPRRERRLLAAVCGFVTALAGSSALAGWTLGKLSLASLVSDAIPMAPSTALFFFLYGITVVLRAILPSSVSVRGTGIVVHSVGAVVAFFLSVLSYLGMHSSAEHLWIPISGTLGNVPIGHISPVTAICFILSSLSFLTSYSTSSKRVTHATMAWWLAVLLLSGCIFFFLAYLYGAPLLYGGPFIPPALTTLLAFTVMGMALLSFASREAKLPYRLNGTLHTSTSLLIFLFVTLTAGIVTAGYFSYRHHEQRYRAETENRLSAIADLKVGEILQWRRERLGDANLFFRNDNFSGLVRQHLDRPSQITKERLEMWLQKVQTAHQYDRVFLLDTENAQIASSPPSEERIAPYLAHHADRARQSQGVVFLDFHRHGKGEAIHLSILVPIIDSRQGGAAIGVLVLRVDPTKYLYPLVQRWPAPSQTGETLLVRRVGNEVVYLNELRFASGAALNLRISTGRKDLPAAKAVAGNEGIAAGIDYRGIPVVSALRSIPDSPWFLVAKTDASEVYAPMRERLWLTILLVGALLVTAGTGTGLAWRQQGAAFYKERYRAEKQFRTLFETMTEGVALHELVSGDDGRAVDYRILAVNPAFEGHTGIAREEAEGSLASVLYGIGTAPFLQEFEHVARTSEPLKFEVYFAPMKRHFRIGANSPSPGMFATVFEDITERKEKEKELQEKNAELERFTYAVSHDLKSPLVTVRTFLGYLGQDMARADQARIDQDMMYMRTATDKMGRLLDELLDLARVGRKVNPPAEVSFRELVKEALDLVAGRIAERGVKVRVDETDVTLHGDRPRLVEIWQNLIENSVKFMGNQAKPLIEIGAARRNGGIIFSVRDNGRGIDPMFKEKVFGLFEKLDSGTEGTGIGLALVRRIVEFYGGAIWIESEGAGKGTSFFFTLPGAINGEGNSQRRD